MADHPKSPLAPEVQAVLPAIRGVRLAIAETGIRYKNRPDVLVAVLDPGTTVAGTFHEIESRVRRRSIGASRRSPGGAAGRSSSMPAMPMPSPARPASKPLPKSPKPRQSSSNASLGRSSRPRPASSASRSIPLRSPMHSRSLVALGARGRLGCGRAGDHDDRHFCQDGDGDGAARREPR